MHGDFHTHKGFATPEGTRRLAVRQAGLAPDFYSEAQGLSLSSLGIGTYLGDHDDGTDRRYADAVKRAVSLGINHIDTAINYRFQRSERSIGLALEELLHAKQVKRDEVFVATKAGFLPFDGAPPRSAVQYLETEIIDKGLARPEEIVSGCHCIAPSYLDAMLKQSLHNLRLDTIDLFYLHNPEQQLAEVERPLFLDRIRAAFRFLEGQVQAGTIRFYGTATWNGYRVAPEDPGHLSLREMAALARDVGGESHHFRFIQAPYNLAMPELYRVPTQESPHGRFPLLHEAVELGVSVVCSASIYQSRLAGGLPQTVSDFLPGLETDAQRALQFVRSAPGVVTALCGMSRVGHVEENCGVARVKRAVAGKIQEMCGH
ncbi:MAG: aldo/keto reductase [Planctomycetes bacterium]|nr:aldo/keto reductase [Planctomycetota bacterium]